MDLQLKDKQVLITGSSRGIGLTIALAFAREGARPVLVARDRGNLEKAEQAFVQAGLAKPQALLVDLSRSGSADELRGLVPDIDILVNNAGAIPGGTLQEVSEARWRDAWEAGAAPRADYICGATGNAALMAFTCAVGGDSMKHGVRVFGINPSPTRSDRMQGMLEQQAISRLGDASRWAELTGKFPLGRLAEPAEMAQLAVFCASPLCGYLSGSVINVDGGQMFATTGS